MVPFAQYHRDPAGHHSHSRVCQTDLPRAPCSPHSQWAGRTSGSCRTPCGLHFLVADWIAAGVAEEEVDAVGVDALGEGRQVVDYGLEVVVGMGMAAAAHVGVVVGANRWENAGEHCCSVLAAVETPVEVLAAGRTEVVTVLGTAVEAAKTSLSVVGCPSSCLPCYRCCFEPS